MLLLASSRKAAGDILAGLIGAGFVVSLKERRGTYAFAVEVSEHREGDVLNIAKEADPTATRE